MDDSKLIMIIFVIIIVFVLIIYFLLFTPDIVINKIFGKIAGNDIEFIYYNLKNKNFEKYNFNPEICDTELFCKNIKKNKINYKILNNYEIPKLNHRQIITSKIIKNYDLFISSISYFLYNIIKKKEKKLNITVIVSVRKDEKEGNFIKFANYTIYPKESLNDIAKKNYDEIENIKNNKHRKINTTLDEFLQLNKSNLIIYSLSNLSEIEKDNNKGKIKRINYNYINNNDWDELINEPNNKLLLLDLINNEYIITYIKKYKNIFNLFN